MVLGCPAPGQELIVCAEEHAHPHHAFVDSDNDDPTQTFTRTAVPLSLNGFVLDDGETAIQLKLDALSSSSIVVELFGLG